MANIVLKNDRLKVEIAAPGEDYKGGRYDWTGITRQITLDGKHTFLTPEVPDSMDGGGLMGVWEFKSNGFFEDSELGEQFPLMGVGLLGKGSLAFDRAADFAILPFRRNVQVSDEGDYVSFETFPTSCHGRAMYQFKEMWIEDNSLFISQNIRNVGTKALDLTEFNHNFMCFDGQKVDASYKLVTGYKPIVDVRRGMIGVETDGIRLIEMDEPTASAACKIDGFQGMPNSFWQVKNDKTKTAVDIAEDFPCARSYNWFCDQAFCCETFCDASLEPGEELSFTRQYTFHEL